MVSTRFAQQSWSVKAIHRCVEVVCCAPPEVGLCRLCCTTRSD